jgi:hypothetical protein
MAEIEKLLRKQLMLGDEVKVQSITVTAISGEITSQLTAGERVRHLAYNASDSGSGELYYGPSEVTALDGFPILKGLVVELPLEADIFVIAESGEVGDLRILELA